MRGLVLPLFVSGVLLAAFPLGAGLGMFMIWLSDTFGRSAPILFFAAASALFIVASVVAAALGRVSSNPAVRASEGSAANQATSNGPTQTSEVSK